MSAKEYIKLLAKGCPIHNSPAADCVLGSIRSLPPKERDARIKALGETEIDIIVQKHLQCSCLRKNSII